jgi:hypothetical protein
MGVSFRFSADVADRDRCSVVRTVRGETGGADETQWSAARAPEMYCAVNNVKT